VKVVLLVPLEQMVHQVMMGLTVLLDNQVKVVQQVVTVLQVMMVQMGLQV
jgi:hypothetical protein